MDRRSFLATLGLITCRPEYVFAQGTPKSARIGWLTAQREASLTPYVKAMRESLVELGYVEGKNLTIDFRYGDDAIERVPELAAELERLPVDLVVAQGAAVQIISKLKLKSPVVYVFSGDPVSAGFAESLAKSHGNTPAQKESAMYTHRFGRKLKLPSTVAIKHAPPPLALRHVCPPCSRP
jgi:ABC-type uncharacterized transport system substrate-binding protein